MCANDITNMQHVASLAGGQIFYNSEAEPYKSACRYATSLVSLPTQSLLGVLQILQLQMRIFVCSGGWMTWMRNACWTWLRPSEASRQLLMLEEMSCLLKLGSRAATVSNYMGSFTLQKILYKT